jgi:hypothetical protein
MPSIFDMFETIGESLLSGFGGDIPTTTTDPATEPAYNWQDLGWTGEAGGEDITGVEDLLGQFFEDPSQHAMYFEDYDPLQEELATELMQSQLGELQEGTTLQLQDLSGARDLSLGSIGS